MSPSAETTTEQAAGRRSRRARAMRPSRPAGRRPTAGSPPRSPGESKALAAEDRTALVRFIVVGLNIVTYWAWLEPQGLGRPWLAALVSVAAFAYGSFDLATHPQRRFPVLLTAAWTTATDGALILLWLAATGGFASPYYLLWYLSLVAVTFRFSWRPPVAAALAYSAAYVALVAAEGQLDGNGVALAIRVAYVLLCGGLGALLAHESARAFEARARMEVTVRQAAAERAAEEAVMRVQGSAYRGQAREASERLATLVDSSIDGIFTKELDGTITSWNPSCEALFGYPAREAVGRSSTMLCVPGEEREELELLEQVSRGQPVRVLETERVRKDGSRVWVSVSASPLRDAAGVVIACAAIVRDITSTRALDQERAAARQATARLAAVVDSSVDGILTKDLEGRVTSWNQGCEAMFGYGAAEIVGRHITVLYPKGKEAEEQRILERIRAGEQVRIREAERMRKDGSSVWISVSASPLRDASGTIVGIASINRDVSEARLMERERAEAKGRMQELMRLQDVNRFKTQFINTAAHELRTPLLPLRMQLDLMMTDEQEPPRPAQLEAMQVMRRNLERLGTLVEDLLTIARSQAGRIELQLQPVDLAGVLASAHESFQAVALRKGVGFPLPPADPLQATVDAKRLSQVLANLLGNAFTFTPEGGEVRLAAGADDDRVRVEVTDTGRGIAKADQAKLFQPFVQVHDQAMAQPGSGLGLYICKQIVELHGGAIGVESAGVGHGATFWFTVPRTPPSAPAPPTPAAPVWGVA